MGGAFQSHQDLASLSVCRTVKLKTKDLVGKSKKQNQWSPFPFLQPNTLSHQRLTLVKSDPIYECFLETCTLDPKNLDGFVGCCRVDQIPKYWHVLTRILCSTLLVFSHTRWHYFNMICLYPWLCPPSCSSVASVYMKFHKSNLPHCYCHNHLDQVDVSHFTCDAPKRMVCRVECCKCDFWKHLVDSKS